MAKKKQEKSIPAWPFVVSDNNNGTFRVVDAEQKEIACTCENLGMTFRIAELLNKDHAERNN